MVGWLSQQHHVKTGDCNQSMNLVETWTIDHVETWKGKFHTDNKFTISELGAVGMSCFEKPSLSVMYPSAGQPPVILSRDTIYYSATFVKIHGKEYLAAYRADGCLYLWDIETQTSKKVFDPLLPSEQRYKGMNIFKISESTIGYGERIASADGSRRVFVLNTDKEEVTLSSTLRLFTSKNIWDMCYTEVDGGSPCLLLCLAYGPCIMAVEMIGGKTRWEVGKQQMGEKFKPYTACTDHNDTVYVADKNQNMIHVLSTADGSVIKQISCRNYGIYNIFTVRSHDQHLYVEHMVPGPKSKFAISKFKESNE